MRRVLMTLIAAAWLLPGLALADADTGQEIAERACTPCHIVVGIQRGPARVPAFSKMAQTFTDQQVREVLLHPHGGMQLPDLTKAEIDDLIAYLASLR